MDKGDYVTYTKEQFAIDKRLLQLAESRLSARVAGHSGVELQSYRDDYFKIADRFAPDYAMVHVVKVMFIDLMVCEPLHGFDCLRYEKLLKVVKQKLGSLMFFRRKKVNEITCLSPESHLQPCFCSHLLDAKIAEGLNEISPA